MLLQVKSVAAHLKKSMRALFDSGNVPLNVLVQMACVDASELNGVSLHMRSLRFVHDAELSSESGWIVSQERWDAFTATLRQEHADHWPPRDTERRQEFPAPASLSASLLSMAAAAGSYGGDADGDESDGDYRPSRSRRRPRSQWNSGNSGMLSRSVNALSATRPLAAIAAPIDTRLQRDWSLYKTLLRGAALAQFFSAHPTCGLSQYNADGGSSVWTSTSSLADRVLRCSTSPTVAGAVVDTATCSCPFVCSPPPANLGAMLGVGGILFHLGLDVSAMVASMVDPISVLVAVAVTSELQCTDDSPDAALPLHGMIFIPDRTSCGADDDGGGWLLPPTFLQRHRLPEQRLLNGELVAAALVAWPDLSLRAYNDDPCLYRSDAREIIMRTTAILLAGAPVDLSLISAPFCGCDVPAYVAPAIGLLNVGPQIGRALDALGAPLCEILVPVAFRETAAELAVDESHASHFVRLVFVADDSGGGWLVAPELAGGSPGNVGTSFGSAPSLALPPADGQMRDDDGAVRWPAGVPPSFESSAGGLLGGGTQGSLQGSLAASLLKRRTPRKRDRILSGAATASVLSTCPELSLAHYNAGPLYSQADLIEASTRAWLRTSAPPTESGAELDPRTVTAPILGRTVPARMLAAVGVTVVFNQVSRALAALRADAATGGARPVVVALVPLSFALNGGTARGAAASALRRSSPSPVELVPMLFAPDTAGLGGFLFVRSDEFLPQVWRDRGAPRGVIDSVTDSGAVPEGPLSELATPRDSAVASPPASPDGPAAGCTGETFPFFGSAPDASMQMSAPSSTVACLALGPALACALAAHPHLSLAAYNDQPTIPEADFGAVILRTAVRPAAGDTIDALLTTAPFSALGGDVASSARLSAVLGVSDCDTLLGLAAMAIRACKRSVHGLAVCVAVSAVIAATSLGVLGVPAAPAGLPAALRALVFVPDAPVSHGDGSSGGGWLVTASQWARLQAQL